MEDDIRRRDRLVHKIDVADIVYDDPNPILVSIEVLGVAAAVVHQRVIDGDPSAHLKAADGEIAPDESKSTEDQDTPIIQPRFGSQD
jgi:hypothetical protein